MEYTAPTGFRFLDEPMFCFSTLNANTNPNPNCRPGHRPWPLTPWQSLPGRRPWPLTPWQSLPGHRPWPLTRFIMESNQCQKYIALLSIKCRYAVTHRTGRLHRVYEAVTSCVRGGRKTHGAVTSCVAVRVGSVQN